MLTNLDSIKFKYNEEDFNLFDIDQKRHLEDIEKYYVKLKARCLENIEIINTGTHKEWITARINVQTTTSLMSLLYLSESFCDSVQEFNLVATAMCIKAMVEIPIHLGYLLWVISEHDDFEEVRKKLHEIAFGQLNPKNGLVHKSNISQKTLYKKSDIMIKKMFGDTPNAIDIFENIYKEANATGHNNYEIRNLLCGNQSGELNKRAWSVKDRKEWFVFINTKIFPFFLHCSTIMSMSDIFMNAINHTLNQLPDNFIKQ